MKKFFKQAFWAFFIAWNILVLYIVTGRQQPKHDAAPIAQTQIAEKAGAKKYVAIEKKASVKTLVENDDAIFEFAHDKLINVSLKKYKERDLDTHKKILDNDDLHVAWSGAMPNNNAKWNITKEDNVVTMTHTNRDNITFIQRWKIENYAIAVETEVLNNSSQTISTQAAIVGNKHKFEQHQSLIFSGISICADKKVKNIGTHKLHRVHGFNARSGWCSFNEKYWLIACISKNAMQFNAQEIPGTLEHSSIVSYEMRAINQQQQIAPHSKMCDKFYLYTGPKELYALQNFGTKIEMPNIENTIDYGWLFFLTKPVHYILDLLIENLGVVFALILLTVILKLLTWPFTSSAHRSMQRMHALSPQLEALRTRLKDNPQLLNSETIALYRRHNINPAGSLLGGILQMFMIFPLYKVLSFSINLYGASFPFWIKDLSVSDPTTITNLFGLLPINGPEFLHIGLWPVLMGVTSIVQQKLSSAPMSPEQRKTMYMLPLIFVWVMSSLPAGVVIYWTLTNLFAILQILYINYTDKDIQKTLHGKR